MEVYTSKTPLFAKRTVEELDEEIGVGDQIRVGRKYTATCQKISKAGALFLLDEYLDQDIPMNGRDTNEGGYEKSDLRAWLQTEEALKPFKAYRERMVKFENGDILRIPTHAEIFGEEDAEYFEKIPGEQWQLMKDRKNRIAFRCNKLEWGWLQNKRKGFAASFASVNYAGNAYHASASSSFGVRPAFLII